MPSVSSCREKAWRLPPGRERRSPGTMGQPFVVTHSRARTVSTKKRGLIAVPSAEEAVRRSGMAGDDVERNLAARMREFNSAVETSPAGAPGDPCHADVLLGDCECRNHRAEATSDDLRVQRKAEDDDAL